MAELSYPSLRCVLEYLEANKRIHISSRSPFLQKFEKSIPLHLESLEPQPESLKINKIIYSIQKSDDIFTLPSDPQYKKQAKVTPGDIEYNLNDYVFWKPNSAKFCIRRFHQEFSKQTKLEEHEAIKVLMCSLLGGRGPIQVHWLKFVTNGYGILRFPENLKLNPERIAADTDIRYFLPLITQSSLPLKWLSIRIPIEEIYDLEVVKTAEHLTIVCGWDDDDDFLPVWAMNRIRTLTNPSLLISRADQVGVLPIIGNWIGSNRKVGDNLKISCIQFDWLDEALEMIRREYRAKEVTIPNFNKRRCFLIPNLPFGELIFYGSRGMLELRIVPIGSSLPVVRQPIEVVAANSETKQTEKNPDGTFILLAYLIVGFVAFLIGRFCF